VQVVDITTILWFLYPNTINLIKELAKDVEIEWPGYDYIYSKLKYSAEPYQIAALVGPDKQFYEAIYGYSVDDVLSSMTIEKIVYKGVRNRYTDEDLRRAVKALAQEYCHVLVVNYVVNALEGLGYEVDLRHRGFSEYGYYCRYTAREPSEALYVYVCSFAVSPPDIGKDERAGVLIEGVGAKLVEYLSKLREDSWRAHLANALWLCVYKHGIYVFEHLVKNIGKEKSSRLLRRVILMFTS